MEKLIERVKEELPEGFSIVYLEDGRMLIEATECNKGDWFIRSIVAPRNNPIKLAIQPPKDAGLWLKVVAHDGVKSLNGTALPNIQELINSLK